MRLRVAEVRHEALEGRLGIGLVAGTDLGVAVVIAGDGEDPRWIVLIGLVKLIVVMPSQAVEVHHVAQVIVKCRIVRRVLELAFHVFGDRFLHLGAMHSARVADHVEDHFRLDALFQSGVDSVQGQLEVLQQFPLRLKSRQIRAYDELAFANGTGTWRIGLKVASYVSTHVSSRYSLHFLHHPSAATIANYPVTPGIAGGSAGWSAAAARSAGAVSARRSDRRTNVAVCESLLWTSM